MVCIDLSTQPRLTIPQLSHIQASPLRTERLLLQPLKLTDCHELNDVIEKSRKHLEQWLTWPSDIKSSEDCREFIHACICDWNEGIALRFAIRNIVNREFVGIVGFDHLVHAHRSCELVYWLKRKATGEGRMCEAAKALVRFAFDSMEVHRVHCSIAIKNSASLKIMNRLRFQFEGIERQKQYISRQWFDHAIFSKLDSDPD